MIDTDSSNYKEAKEKKYLLQLVKTSTWLLSK